MTYKEQYLNRLILYSYTIKYLGLLYGRLGHILALFELSKDSKYCAQLVYYANRELERIISSVSKNTSVEFADGLCGIGWGIEYLIYNGFVEGNSIEICEEIDAQLMSANLKSFDNSLENGIKGVLHYVLAHLANCCLQNKGMPFRHQAASRHYKPNDGTIKVGGVNLDNINPHVWRKSTGSVMQESFIFSDTIAKNIALSTDDVDVERLYESALLANADELISALPLSYNTRIGMEGCGVSQGQRQRLLIARAIYKNPKYLFFDEATNSLDATNERIIMENLHKIFENRTVVHYRKG